MTAAPPPSPLVASDFAAPFCSAASEMKFGYVELEFRGVPPELFQTKEVEMEELFRTIYNNITGWSALFSKLL